MPIGKFSIRIFNLIYNTDLNAIIFLVDIWYGPNTLTELKLGMNKYDKKINMSKIINIMRISQVYSICTKNLQILKLTEITNKCF